MNKFLEQKIKEITDGIAGELIATNPNVPVEAHNQNRKFLVEQGILAGINLLWPCVEAAKKVYLDEETGHWGPDVTMKAVLENALSAIGEV